jgi:hypothetical protein
VADFEEVLASRCDGRESLLLAWDRYGNYDGNAARLQDIFGWVQGLILVFGILAVFIATLEKAVEPASQSAHSTSSPLLSPILWSMHFATLVLPILGAVCVGISHQFRPGDKWVQLRGAAEAVKREIFHYRSRAGGFSSAKLSGRSPEVYLAERLKTISQRLNRTEVSRSGNRTFPPRFPKNDDGYSRLTPARYMELRLDDQISFYNKRVLKLGQRLSRYSVGSLIIGSSGTIFAAINHGVWIAVTTAFATALTTYLRYYQTEETLIKYNCAKADLLDIKAWWAALTPVETKLPQNAERLVEITEQVLEQETAGWSQRMIDILSELHRKAEEHHQAQPDATTDKKTRG